MSHPNRHLQVVVSGRVRSEIKRLQQQTEAASRNEVVRHALKMFEEHPPDFPIMLNERNVCRMHMIIPAGSMERLVRLSTAQDVSYAEIIRRAVLHYAERVPPPDK